MPQESPCKLNSRCWRVLELEVKSCQCSITVLEISQLGLEVQHSATLPDVPSISILGNLAGISVYLIGHFRLRGCGLLSKGSEGRGVLGVFGEKREGGSQTWLIYQFSDVARFQYGESLGLAPGHLGESPMRTGESLRRVPKNIKYVRWVRDHLLLHVLAQFLCLNGASLWHYVILNSTICVFYLVAWWNATILISGQNST